MELFYAISFAKAIAIFLQSSNVFASNGPFSCFNVSYPILPGPTLSPILNPYIARCDHPYHLFSFSENPIWFTLELGLIFSGTIPCLSNNFCNGLLLFSRIVKSSYMILLRLIFFMHDALILLYVYIIGQLKNWPIIL